MTKNPFRTNFWQNPQKVRDIAAPYLNFTHYRKFMKSDTKKYYIENLVLDGYASWREPN